MLEALLLVLLLLLTETLQLTLTLASVLFCLSMLQTSQQSALPAVCLPAAGLGDLYTGAVYTGLAAGSCLVRLVKVG